MMAGVFTLLLIFATLVYSGKLGGADAEHTDHSTSNINYVLILGSFIVPHLTSASVVTTFMGLFYAMPLPMMFTFLAATV